MPVEETTEVSVTPLYTLLPGEAGLTCGQRRARPRFVRRAEPPKFLRGVDGGTLGTGHDRAARRRVTDVVDVIGESYRGIVAGVFCRSVFRALMRLQAANNAVQNPKACSETDRGLSSEPALLTSVCAGGHLSNRKARRRQDSGWGREVTPLVEKKVQHAAAADVHARGVVRIHCGQYRIGRGH